MGWNRSLSPGEEFPNTKLTLRFISLLLTVIAIILSGLSIIYAWPLLIPLAFTFIWDLANIIRRLTAQTPVVPGANVGVDLVTWLTFVVALLFVWAEAIQRVRFVGYGYYYYYSYGYTRNSAKIGLGAAAVGTLVALLTFALWIWACVDCHRYRYSDRYPAYRRGIKGGNGPEVAPYPVQGAGVTNGQIAYGAGPGQQENAQHVYA